MQAAARRGDEAHVELDGHFRAGGRDLAFLDDAQQLGLQLQRQVSNVIQEQRAAVSLHDPAALGFRRPSGTGWTAEQLGLHQDLRQRAAVDGDEGLVGALAGRMQCAAEVFLARAGFTGDQDGNVARLQTLGRLDVAAHRRIAQVQLIEHAAACAGGWSLLGRGRCAHAACLVALGLGCLRDRKEPAAVARLVDRQCMEGFLLAAADECRERDVEHALQRRADQLVGALEAELEEGIAIERGDGALGVQSENALAPGADQLGPAVEAHDVGILEPVQEQAVLDHLRRHVDQHQRVLLGAVGLPGGIQDRHQLPAIVENRRGAAGETDVARKKVLVAMDDQRRALEQARPHPVGAAVLLAPHRAQDQAGPERGVTEAQVTVVIQEHSVAVGEDDGVTRTGQLVVEVGHLRVGEGDQLEVLLLARKALFARQHIGFPLRLGIEVILRQTTQPGTLDVVRRAGAVLARGASEHRLNVPGMTAYRLEHGLPPHVWRSSS